MKITTQKYRTGALMLAACVLALCLAGCAGTTLSQAPASEAAVSTQVETELLRSNGTGIQTTKPITEPVTEVTEVTEKTVEPAPETAEPETEPETATPAETEAASASAPTVEQSASAAQITTTANVTSTGMIDASALFSSRDLNQSPDLTDAVYLTVTDGQDLHITQEGVYVLTGTAANVTVYVETDQESDAKVQLVLDGVSIVNDDFPCIYVTQADKVFVTTTDTVNSLCVTGTFVPDGDTNTDGVIFSRDDLVLNGLGVLTISSTDNGVVCKDDLKITGGTYTITAASKAIEANDSIRIAAGTFDLTAGTDGLHAENEDDDTLGYIYICGGSFHISAGDDGIHGVSVVQIDDGSFTITAAEGIEGTYIQINGGTISIESWDDGINGAKKSTAYPATVEITGGTLTIRMASGDTDGVDSNGNLIISGGTIDVTGQSTFDCDGTVTFTGGTVIVNGQQVTTIPTQMMGGWGGRGGWMG